MPTKTFKCHPTVSAQMPPKIPEVPTQMPPTMSAQMPPKMLPSTAQNLAQSSARMPPKTCKRIKHPHFHYFGGSPQMPPKYSKCHPVDAFVLHLGGRRVGHGVDIWEQQHHVQVGRNLHSVTFANMTEHIMKSRFKRFRQSTDLGRRDSRS